MNLRFVLFGAALISGSAFAAEPPKAPVERAAQPQQTNSPVVLASADDLRDQGAQPSTTPAKHRVARVTTCRCGDQQPTDSDAQPEQ